MQFIKKWNAIGLVTRILIGLALGVTLALTIPGLEVISLLGSLFVSALKAVAPILVLFLITSAIANAKQYKTVGSVVVLYLLATICAALLATVASILFPVSLTLVDAVQQTSPESLGEVLTNIVLGCFANPIEALANGNYLGILTWGVVLGLAIKNTTDATKSVITTLAEALTTIVRWVISLAPFGILGLVYTAVSTSGIEIFAEYGSLLLVLVGCMLTMALIVNPLIAFIRFKKNPYPLVFKCLRESAITAFFTRSSAANIPVNMQLCSKLGLNPEDYSVSIPLGATINMSGAAITITVMTLAAAHTQGIQVDFVTAFLLSVVAALGACGASGVAGGSLLLIPMACSLFGIPGDVAMQVVGIGFIIGVVQDSFETALNSSADVLFTATAEYANLRKEGKDFNPGVEVATK